MNAQSAKATWIWYPGDFEIWLSNQMQNRRTERFAFVPPFWRVYSHNPQVNFSKQVDLPAPEEVTVAVEGKFNVTINGRYVQQPDMQRITIPAGKHDVNFQVFNQGSPPSVYVQGKSIVSDSSWKVELVRNNSADNIPGRAKHGNAGNWNFHSMDKPPSAFRLPVKEVSAVKVDKKQGAVLVDFGQETFGFVQLKNLKGSGKVSLYYGESMEEALSADSCETFDFFHLTNHNGDFTSDHSRALRFVNIVPDGSI
ncbi:MAG: alpha-rhamnosidase, partial [Flavisolibacter sp.]|nr:alpha-rhamnosidase [Flavisolibacter sp.]